jgi:hypothetical protein
VGDVVLGSLKASAIRCPVKQSERRLQYTSFTFDFSLRCIIVHIPYMVKSFYLQSRKLGICEVR